MDRARSDMGNGSPGGAGLAFERGAWLLTDPCVEKETGNWTPVGPTVADFVDAVAKHPILDTTNARRRQARRVLREVLRSSGPGGHLH